MNGYHLDGQLMPSVVHRTSVVAPVNIAVVKYWGKRDAILNLPTNPSISVTLATTSLRTHTTASCSALYRYREALILNSVPQDVSNSRFQACIRELRSIRSDIELSNGSLPKLAHLPLLIVSENNFPTGAGLASSASGFAALVCAVAKLYGIQIDNAEISRIARVGSGSACRSLFGGFVGWQTGIKPDGDDSIAVQIAPASHWPSLRAIIIVVSREKKNISSTIGMQITVRTSSLFEQRVDVVVPVHIEMMERAIKDRDFDTFAKVTMADSNSFHSVCLDSFPPISYLNDVSHAAIQMVHYLNRKSKRTVAAYTFDAGPNAVIFYQEQDETSVIGKIKGILGNVSGWTAHAADIMPLRVEGFDDKSFQLLQRGVRGIIMTGVGNGPSAVVNSLISSDGQPQSCIPPQMS